MATPSAIAIVNTTNCPLLIRTNMDDVDKEEAIKLIYLMHASLDIVEEKSEQPTSRDNFLGTLYQCEQYKIFGLMSTTKVKILLVYHIINYYSLPRENDIRQTLKNIHRAYVDATAMNPFHKPNEPVESKRLNAYLDTLLAPAPEPGAAAAAAAPTAAVAAGAIPASIPAAQVQTVAPAAIGGLGDYQP